MHWKISWNHYQKSYVTENSSKQRFKFSRLLLPILHFHGKFLKIFRCHGKIRQSKAHFYLLTFIFTENWANQQTNSYTAIYVCTYLYSVFSLKKSLPTNILDTNSWKFDWVDILLLRTYPLFCLCATFSMHISASKKSLEGLCKVSFLTIRVQHTSMLCTHQNSKQRVAHFLFVKTK